MSELKNWAKWMIDHKLSWMLYVHVWLIGFPCQLVLNIFMGAFEAFDNMRHVFGLLPNEIAAYKNFREKND
jgi:hypothetical protein